VKSGLLHQVFKIRGSKRVGVLKVREAQLSGLPQYTHNPQDIIYEYRALQLLNTLCDTTFPQVLDFDLENALLMTSDVMPSGRTLEDELNDGRTTDEDMYRLGVTVSTVHNMLKPIPFSSREEGDDEVLQEDVHYRLGYHNNPILNQLINELNNLPKQLILADLSPKNIGKDAFGRPTICDLDDFYRGTTTFALGYLSGHVVVHNLHNSDRTTILLGGLHEGYKDEGANVDIEGLPFKRVALGTVLYRIYNPLIPYRRFTQGADIKDKANRAFSLLGDRSLTWDDITKNMTS